MGGLFWCLRPQLPGVVRGIWLGSSEESWETTVLGRSTAPGERHVRSHSLPHLASEKESEREQHLIRFRAASALPYPTIRQLHTPRGAQKPGQRPSRPLDHRHVSRQPLPRLLTPAECISGSPRLDINTLHPDAPLAIAPAPEAGILL